MPKTLPQVLSSNAAYKILGTHGDTWMQGGCAILAHALQGWLGGEIWAVVDSRGRLQHAVLFKDGMFIDSNGAQSEETMAYKLHLEGVDAPRLVPMNQVADLSTTEIVCPAGAVRALQKLLESKSPSVPVIGLPEVGELYGRDTQFNPKQTGKKVSPAEVVEALEQADSTDDPGWVGVLVDQVLKHPEWQLITLDPKKTTNFYLPEDEAEEDALRELSEVLDTLPPIVAVPDVDNPKKYDIIDGAHRTAAALATGQKIKAYVPA